MGGWKNKATWQVVIHIGNTPETYFQAVDFMSTYKGRTPYQDFVDAYGYISTFDGGLFNDPTLSKSELNWFMRDLVAK